MAFNPLLRRYDDVGAKRGRVEALMRGHMTRHEIIKTSSSTSVAYGITPNQIEIAMRASREAGELTNEAFSIETFAYKIVLMIEKNKS